MISYIKKIGPSIYGPAYYRELLGKPFAYSLKYFFVLLLCMSLISTIIFSVRIIPSLLPLINNVSEKIINYFPAELQLTIKAGKVTTNVTEPYSIPMPPEVKNDKNKQYTNLLVIDTKTPFTLDQFKQYTALGWLTADSLIYEREDGQIIVQSLQKAPDYTLTRESLASLIAQFKPLLNAAAPLLIVIIFGLAVFAFTSKLIYVLLGALVILVIAKMMKVPMQYAKAYQFGLHVLTLPTLIQYLFVYVGVPLVVPFGYSIVFIIMAVVNLKSIGLTQQTLPLKTN